MCAVHILKKIDLRMHVERAGEELGHILLLRPSPRMGPSKTSNLSNLSRSESLEWFLSDQGKKRDPSITWGTSHNCGSLPYRSTQVGERVKSLRRRRTPVRSLSRRLFVFKMSYKCRES